MKNLKQIISFFLVSQAYFLFGQDNLVPNPSFEDLNGKPKKIGEIDKAAPWKSPTLGTAEIFWTGSKSDDISSPKNKLGYQVARTGNNYAGAILYDKKNQDLREYIQVELMEELDSGKVYCIEFFVNVADFSKYSVDLVGAYLSEKEFSYQNMDPIGVVPQVVNKSGRVLGNQAEWEIVCGEMKAKGGEKFITIGNFSTDKQLKVGRLKKPKMVGAQNEYGYYFIDDVSVIEQDVNYACDCFKKTHGANTVNIVYSKVTGENEERLHPEDLIESKNVYFETGKIDFPTSALADLNVLIKLMNQNNDFVLEITGYGDDAELTANSTIGEQRANKIAEHLVKNGIRKDRIISSSGTITKMPGRVVDASRSRKVDFSVIIE
ncbi:MAG: OmpA family protein [Bacteroidetes bacterium]|nr:OmpA family protein [Bacteroidota bacterium]HET6245027.1 OmpA family protein [Bacteroidia bacterium]